MAIEHKRIKPQTILLQILCILISFHINYIVEMDLSHMKMQFTYRKTIKLISNEEKPDFFLILKDATFPLKKVLLSQSLYFKNITVKDDMTHILQHDFDVSDLKFVLEHMLGNKQSFPHNKQLLRIIDIAQYLQYKNIEEDLKSDISINFEDYGFFLLMRLEKKLKIEWLFQKLCHQIVDLNFEHINFNKVDLLQYEKKQFVSIMRKYYRLLQFNIIKGLSKENIDTIFKLYENTHQVVILKSQLYRIEQEDYQFVQDLRKIKDEQIGQKKGHGLQRKRSKSLNNYKFDNQAKKKDSVSTCDQNLKLSVQQNKYKQEIDQLMLINNNLIQKGENLYDQVHSLKQHYSESRSQYDLEEHDTVLRYQKEWKQKQSKYSQVLNKLRSRLESKYSYNERNKRRISLDFFSQLGAETNF